MKRTVLMGCGLLLGIIAGAAVPDRDWPSVEVTPSLDVPMRDTAITRGPDGMYYLTGTLGVRKADWPDSSDSSDLYDFENSHQIKLWKSKDLKLWEEIGVVWDIDRQKGRGNWHWTAYWRAPMEARYRPPVRGVTAPELHYIKNNWYLCFSMNGQGTGLLKSSSGKPEGPYEEVGQITTKGGDPSMFEDDDGKVYWLFDGGYIARMTEDLTALAERPRILVPAHDPSAPLKKNEAKNWPEFKWADDPMQVGARGAFLFKVGNRYYLTAADYNSRLGRPCNDTWVAYADNIYGPYSERHLMVPHGGGITVFRGPSSSAIAAKYRGPYDSQKKQHIEGEQLYASFYGADERAIVRDRPSFLPLEWVGPDRWDVYFFKHAESFPRKPQAVFTECGPWSRMKPLPFKEQMRDISILNAPDGFYYLTCSGVSRPGELVVYRSSDLASWEEFKTVWRYEDIEWLPQKIEAIPGDSREAGRARFARTFWDVGMKYLQGTYWIWFNIFPEEMQGLGGPEHHGSGVLRSTTGKPEGPYESLGRKGGHYARDPEGGAPRPFLGNDGKLYANAVINWAPKVAEADLTQSGDWRKLWKFTDVDLQGAAFASDGWGGVCSINGKYVFIGTRWGGPVCNPHLENGGKHFGTYDFSYATGPTPWGPFGRPKPMARNGGMFQDKGGNWWMIFFGNDGTGPWWQRPGLVPLTVTDDGRDIFIDVKMPPYSEYELRIMGGGEIADVKTALETLEEKR